MIMPSQTYAIWILLAPLLACALIGAVGLRGLRDKSHWLAIGGVAAALVLAVLLFGQIRAVPEGAREAVFAKSHKVYEWLRPGFGGAATYRWFDVEFRIDPLTGVMLVTVLAVSLMVVIYSTGYMRDHHGHPERGYERFFAFLALFIFSMCLLVLGGNFVLLYVGWELVGLCSYLLIGFYYPKPSAAAAAKKAFIVTRVGDFGFALGIFMIFWRCGDLSYAYVFSEAGMAKLAGWETPIALLLFCGAVGKSAQLPLHTWLPDAMEGPSPVSALIHAATMVTAGVYMVARCGAIFVESPTAMATVASVGAVTCFFAATIAITQFDLKRVLAYSTISQLGYMFLGLGVHAADAAIFHLFTHAFFKSLLFLAAGSVMHAMGGIIDMRRFGGLAKNMKITATVFWIAGLALAGFPFLSGFWSKDEILHAALGVSVPLATVGYVTALLTAFYTFRAIFITFHGPLKLPQGVEHAHESVPAMTIPMMILAIGAALGGYVGLQEGGSINELLRTVLVGRTPEHAPAHVMSAEAAMAMSGVLSAVGILSAWYIYRRKPMIAMAAAFSMRGPYELLKNKYYIDELYDAVIVRPLHDLGRFCYGFDRYFINALLWVITAIPRAAGFMLRSLQQGAIQGYAMGMVIGLLVIVVAVLSAT